MVAVYSQGSFPLDIHDIKTHGRHRGPLKSAGDPKGTPMLANPMQNASSDANQAVPGRPPARRIDKGFILHLSFKLPVRFILLSSFLQTFFIIS